ncbi:pyridoxamine 5'-phosphate oxidase family protein [Pseudonocardia ailaonensis]|uniref:Pyridoxamine 5'-phosphate oxidase family protein n=1 Tax=Pseudonocardia ailaonensis TaxID=367279 RepID=A0ABN2MW74_9PSEU
MDIRTVTATLARPVAQELLFSDIPARLSYVGTDGDPRVVPTAFWWTGDTVVLATVVKSAKVSAIRRHPRVALCVDRPGLASASGIPRSLLIRGSATVEIVDGVPEEYVAGSRKITPAEAMPAWEEGVRALYPQMAVITVTPDHVVLHDFGTTIPKAVADLVAAHGDPR